MGCTKASIPELPGWAKYCREAKNLYDEAFLEGGAPPPLRLRCDNRLTGQRAPTPIRAAARIPAITPQS